MSNYKELLVAAGVASLGLYTAIKMAHEKSHWNINDSRLSHMAEGLIKSIHATNQTFINTHMNNQPGLESFEKYQFAEHGTNQPFDNEQCIRLESEQFSGFEYGLNDTCNRIVYNDPECGPGPLYKYPECGPGPLYRYHECGTGMPEPSSNNPECGPGPSYNKSECVPRPSYNNPECGPGPSYNNPEYEPGPSYNNPECVPEPSYNNPECGPRPSYSIPECGPGPSYNIHECGPGPSYNNPECGPGPSYNMPECEPGPSYNIPECGPGLSYNNPECGPGPSNNSPECVPEHCYTDHRCGPEAPFRYLEHVSQPFSNDRECKPQHDDHNDGPQRINSDSRYGPLSSCNDLTDDFQRTNGNGSDLRHLNSVHKKAVNFLRGRKRQPVRDLYRNLPSYLFKKLRRAGKMKPRLKDHHGDPKSTINGKIRGLFFMATHNKDGSRPKKSPFGDTRLVMPISSFFDEPCRLFFADFYCNKQYGPHFVTLVLTKQGTKTEKFCSKNAIELDIKNNAFFQKRSRDMCYCISGGGVWVEIFYGSTVSLKKKGIQWETVTTIGAGRATKGGIPKNPHCNICNVLDDIGIFGNQNGGDEYDEYHCNYDEFRYRLG